MDLDEYRRIYMTMEGVSNTPVNAVKRLFRLGKSVISIPGAAKMDRKEREEKKFHRKLAKDDIKKNGITLSNTMEVIKNRPGGNRHTREALSRTGRSALSVGRSVNELGQTTRSIVGTNRSNPYDGQDYEQGIRFTLNAFSVIGRGLQVPPKMMKAAYSVGHFGNMSIKHIGNEAKVKTEKWREKEQDLDLDR